MQKSYYLMGMIFIAAFAFSACSGDGVKKNAPASLRVLNYFDMAQPDSVEEADRLWDAFEKANPHITIIREDLFGESYYDTIATYTREGQLSSAGAQSRGFLPDVVFAWPMGRSAGLHRGNFLKDLAPLAVRDKLNRRYSPAALDKGLQAGGYLGILPRSITSTHAFYVNTAVLADAGLKAAKTYDELKAQAPVLKSKGYETIIMGNQDSWVMQQCLFSLIAGRFCGEAWEQRILAGEAKFTDPEFMAALEFIRSLYIDGVISRTTLLIDYQDVVVRFAENKAAYFIDGDWRAQAFVTGNPDAGAPISPERQGDIQVTLFPEISGVKLNDSTSVIPGAGWGISANIPEKSAEEQAAWRLVQWLSGKEAQTWLLSSGSISIPSRVDIDEKVLDLEPIQKAIAKLTGEYKKGTAVIDRVFPNDVYTPINDGLQEIGMGTKTPAEVARSVQNAFDAWTR